MLSRLIIRFGGALFLIFALGALLFLISIESTFNGGFEFTIKALALPFGLAIFSFTYINREALTTYPPKPWQPWLMAAMFYPLSLLFGWPYLMAINALSADSSLITYSGPVVEKFVTSGKSTSYHVRIRDVQSGETVALNLPYRVYSGIEVGTPYCAAFSRGLLGIPFRWKYTSNPVFEATCAKSRAGASTPRWESMEPSCVN